jgi:hypothetical protein
MRAGGLPFQVENEILGKLWRMKNLPLNQRKVEWGTRQHNQGEL